MVAFQTRDKLTRMWCRGLFVQYFASEERVGGGLGEDMTAEGPRGLKEDCRVIGETAVQCRDK